MRILHILQFYHPFIGGLEEYMKNLSENLSQRGHDVTVFTSNIVSLTPLIKTKPGLEIINGVRVYRFQSLFPPFSYDNGGKTLSFLSRFVGSAISNLAVLINRLDRFYGVGKITSFFRWLTLPFMPQMLISILLHRDEWDLVVGSTLPWSTPAIAYLVAKLTGKPLIIKPDFHVGVASYECQSFYKIMKDADALIVNTDYEKKELDVRGISKKKIYVVGLGIEPERYMRARGDDLKRRLGIDEDCFLVLYLGRREYDKGYHNVIMSMKHVWKRFSNAKLVLIGPGRSIKIRAEKALDDRCEDFLRDHEDRVIDLGVVEEREKIDALAESDILVMPSRVESFGSVYLEAWMMKKPVVGARSGAVPNVIEDGIDGLLVDFGNEEQLAEKIITLLQDRELRERLGENGYQKTLENYTWNVIADQIERVYRSIEAKSVIPL